MSTKAKPGEFDCLGKLDEHEPYFVLRAKDQLAPIIVRIWAELARLLGCPSAKCGEAVECAKAMDEWVRDHGGAKRPD